MRMLQVLDMCMLLGLVPERFSALKGLDLYFAMARGYESAPALDMSKYLNTNYHYLVRCHFCCRQFCQPPPWNRVHCFCTMHP